MFLHFTLPPPLSLIAFFIWQEERKGRREHRGDFIIEKKEVRKSGEEGAASALARCALPRAGGKWGVACLCVFLHFTLPPPLSLIAFFIFQVARTPGEKGEEGD